MHESGSTVNITFQSPARASRPSSPSHHHRDLEGVPESTAEQMAQDFTAYQRAPSSVSEKQLYTYQPVGNNGTLDDTRFIALDFDEIVTLEVHTPQDFAMQEVT